MLEVRMEITKTAEDRYHVKVKDRDRLIEEDVNDVQLLAMASGRTIGITAEEILNAFEGQPVGYTITVNYA
jgi:hypothetical protein